MRLGVVGMLPSDFRTITVQDFEAVSALRLTGASCGVSGDLLSELRTAECRHARRVFAAAGMDLVQFGIGYGECLFDPDADQRAALLHKIGRGIEFAAELGAHACLIRPGSLSPRGSYGPTRRNLEPACRQRLLETLAGVASKGEAEGVTIVMETHQLTIMDSPETNREVLEAVGSERLRVVMDYVNHFQSLRQVYHSRERMEQIFEVMGPISAIGHCKDARVADGLVLHIEETVPGEGDLDLTTALRCWHELYPDGYMLLEHLPDEMYPRASANVHRLAAAAGIEIH